jgi:hypothetical protein
MGEAAAGGAGVIDTPKADAVALPAVGVRREDPVDIPTPTPDTADAARAR